MISTQAQPAVGVVNWNTEDSDNAKHDAKGLQNVEKGIDTVPKNQEGVVIDFLFTLGHFDAELQQHTLSHF